MVKPRAQKADAITIDMKVRFDAVDRALLEKAAAARRAPLNAEIVNRVRRTLVEDEILRTGGVAILGLAYSWCMAFANGGATGAAIYGRPSAPVEWTQD